MLSSALWDHLWGIELLLFAELQGFIRKSIAELFKLSFRTKRLGSETERVGMSTPSFIHLIDIFHISSAFGGSKVLVNHQLIPWELRKVGNLNPRIQISLMNMMLLLLKPHKVWNNYSWRKLFIKHCLWSINWYLVIHLWSINWPLSLRLWSI